MNLHFMTTFPKGLPVIGGTPTHFEMLIQEGRKIHTLRDDNAERLTKGRQIKFMAGSWRSKRTREMGFAPRHVTGRQNVLITKMPDASITIHVDGHLLSAEDVETFIQNDGFFFKRDFIIFFFGHTNPIPASVQVRKKLIHWKDGFRYGNGGAADLSKRSEYLREHPDALPTAKLHF